MLNGSGSFQQGGDSLTYNWMFTSLPSDSLAFLDDPNAMRPSFTVDVEGEYVVSLVVNNGIADSPPSETFISADNVLPVAYAGPDQTVNGVISLDGSGSFDANGDPLTYRWTVLSKPLESLAVLDNPTDVMPTLITDVSGDFIVGLVVHDGLGNSASDKVVISVGDVPPLADAGPDQPVTIGETVSLDGSGSSDANGDALTYKWTLVSRPFGSNAALDNPTIMAPVFTADVVGDYVAMLIVHDGKRDSLSDSVVISTNNIAPIADAGNSQSVVIGDLAMLEGSGSSDANNDLLDFHWTLTSLPSGSGATLHSPNDEKTSFIPDLPGIYVASLVVDDGVSKSKTDTITISAVNLDTAAIRTLRETIDIINELDASYSPEVFENPNTKKMLTNKLNAVINNIENGEYESALHKMEYELLEKTDGCVLRGEPDKNDWIRDFDAQADVYTLMREAIELL
ncbi:MAG: PKD domain-containing protein [Candidatus Brocadiaceae bacterium]|nr:PKD domain-containing protein [Candidatus Brocadiaceae bacterium]